MAEPPAKLCPEASLLGLDLDEYRISCRLVVAHLGGISGFVAIDQGGQIILHRRTDGKLADPFALR